MSFFDMLAQAKQATENPPVSSETPKSLEEDIKEQLAKGTAPGALAIKLGVMLAEQASTQKQMFVENHDVITMNGLLIQQAPDADIQFTENYKYDPLRSSLGAMWLKTSTEVEYISGLPYGNQAIFIDASSQYESIKKEINATDGVHWCNKVVPEIKYRLPVNYNVNGIETIKITAPDFLLADDNPDDVQNPFRARIINAGIVQYIHIYFNMGGYSDKMRPLLPYSLFYDTKQKMEGVTFPANTDTGYQTLEFESTYMSPKAYDGMLFKQNASEDSLDSIGVETDPESGQFNIGQEAVIFKMENQIFSDHTIRSQHAISKEALPFFGNETLQGSLIADVLPVYNFFVPEWEYATPALIEQALPNIYKAAHSEQVGEFDLGVLGKVIASKYDFKKTALKLITCDTTPEDINNESYTKRNCNIVIQPDKQYMDLVDDMKSQFPMYNEISFKPIPPGEISLAMSEAGLTTSFLRTMLTYLYHDYRDNSIPYVHETLSRIVVLATTEPPLVSDGNDTSIVSRVKDPASLNMFDDKEELITSQKKIPAYDFLSWLEWYLSELDDPPSNDDLKLYDRQIYKKHSTFVGSSKFLDLMSEPNINSFSKAVGIIKFMSRFVEQVTLRQRGIHQIYSGDESHFCSNDILYYRIEKLSTSTGNVIQNYFILPEEVDPEKGYSPELKVIDTNVKYGEDYTYNIFATKIVIGTEYKYTVAPNDNERDKFEEVLGLSVNSDNQAVFSPYICAYKSNVALKGGNSTAKMQLYGLYSGQAYPNTFEYVLPLKVELRPTVKIYECPYYKEEGVIITDNPPLPPIVNMYPLHGKKNKIVMTLETQTGDREMQPITIEKTDTQYFVLERFSQKRQIQYPSGDYIYENLRFKADDNSSVYEIYRIVGEENRPSKYEDFRGKLHKTLDMMAKIPEGGFEDDIEVNTKYYYTFRCKDMHGNISNPSHVYCVEMVDLGEEVFYPIITAHTINELKTQNNVKRNTSNVSKKKALMKRVQIRPADQQILLNEELSGITGETANIRNKEIVLGIAEKSLWNDKKFKFRFTSRHTGRMIDVNVDFTHNKEKQTQEVIEPCFDPKGE